ncbi:zinc transporter 1a [Kryptolebias marmoratus]|uniref:Solute carrier family 30 member 1a n=1 Tax=Kryptolebias marmoratus TaxID=37003 RepID=A0A3Q3GKF7_KRYMA|nr:zinc transporter 1a [Kryptolebias marmoratus]
MACEPNRARLLCMLSLTFSFFVVEVVVSRITASLSMLSDSFHMLSDVIALVVALVAVRFAEKTHSTNKNTFGWIRAEVMGALVNAVFLTALCFTIVLEAIERFTEPHEIESPVMVAVVGAAGLLVNLLGLCLFHGHAGGGGHGHSHGGHSHGGKGKRGKAGKAGNGSAGEETNNLVGNHSSPGDVGQRADVSCKDGSEVQMNGNTHFDELDLDQESSSQLNMRGVFLHVLGDALGSVIVVVNSIIFNFVWHSCKGRENCVDLCIDKHAAHNQTGGGEVYAGPCWVLYLDPTLCLIMVGILLYTTYPLLKESALILLQTVPKQINMHKLNERLLSLDGVLAIHELHIWQLAGSRIIATAHIKCHDPTAYMDVAKRIKDFFHHEGIHATTIQPEFVTFSSESRDSLCELSCRTQCAPKQCCGSGDKKAGGDGRLAATALEVVSETPEQAADVQVCPRTEAEVPVAREVESSL